MLVGLGAQLVDGALGMAYGLVSSSVLLAMGLPPAQVSASIHAAEVFTSGASGVSHLVMGNVDRRLFLRLGRARRGRRMLGAYVLTRIPGELIRPFVYVYLLVLAVLIPGARRRPAGTPPGSAPGAGAGLLRRPARCQRRRWLGPAGDLHPAGQRR